MKFIEIIIVASIIKTKFQQLNSFLTIEVFISSAIFFQKNRLDNNP